MPLMLLPFFGSGFVPTDSMPDPLRWFADNQPFTPIIETLRALAARAAIGEHGPDRRRLVRGDLARRVSLGAEAVRPRSGSVGAAATSVTIEEVP